MTKITDTWVSNPATQRVFRLLLGAGHQAYFVGGCVRNALLKVPVADIDISTSARPQQVMRLAEQAGIAAHPTGIDHGTVTLVADDVPLEVTTFRRDVETDGRRAVVAFADTIQEDALRRDLTMNALYADATGAVVDPLGGLPDLMARRVRFIEDPNQRIKEDYLRILRFFRFHAHYGDVSAGLDADGLAACSANLDGLETLSKERIGAEMRKLLTAADPAPAVAAMQHSGVLTRILPGASSTYLGVLVHLEQDEGLQPNAIRRLAILGGEDHRNALRLSRSDAKSLSILRRMALDDMPLSKMAYQAGFDLARDAMLVKHALMEAHVPDGYKDALNLGANACFPVRAADLPDLSGPDLGKHLRALEDAWVESAFALSKADLLKISPRRS